MDSTAIIIGIYNALLVLMVFFSPPKMWTCLHYFPIDLLSWFKLEYWASQVVLVVKNLPANAGDIGSIPESGRSPGGGNGNLLQCSCLENFMDRGAWQAAVQGVAKSWTWLSTHSTAPVNFAVSRHFHLLYCAFRLSSKCLPAATKLGYYY